MPKDSESDGSFGPSLSIGGRRLRRRHEDPRARATVRGGTGRCRPQPCGSAEESPVTEIESGTFRAVLESLRLGLVRVSSHALTEIILITVYLPDAQRWTEDFRKRRARDAREAA